MDMAMVAAGLVLLFAGGEGLVRGALGIARRLQVSPLLIGLTVVGFGTSMPELLVSLDAALSGAPDIAVGAVVGSNIGNVLLIAGLAAAVRPMTSPGRALRRDLAAMLAASAALIPVFWLGWIGRPAGAALLAGLALYLILAARGGGAGDADAEPETEAAPPVWRAALIALVGLAALALGARWLVDGASSLARAAGVTEAFIGLTVVAVGTSLPELATSLVAAVRGRSDVAVGNIVGSNIFNVLGILGVTALVSPIPVAPRFASFDLPVMIGAAAALALLLTVRPRIGRGWGAAFLVAYAAYVVAAQG